MRSEQDAAEAALAVFQQAVNAADHRLRAADQGRAHLHAVDQRIVRPTRRASQRVLEIGDRLVTLALADLIERLLIVRLSAMGDVIHTLPAAQALREAFPLAMIGWLIEERWAELLCAPGAPRRGPRSAQRPLADWVHTVSLAGWRKSLFTISTLREIAKVWNDVRAARYQVAVDLQGAIRSAGLARMSGARFVYGAAEPRESPASLWYTRRALAPEAHVIEQNLSVTEAVAQRKMKVPRVEFPRDTAAERRIDQRLAEAAIGKFAILNPGAGWGAKRWPAERYGQVAKVLAEVGVRSILNCGPGEDDLARAGEAASEGAAKSMKCSITELIALARRARLFIAGRFLSCCSISRPRRKCMNGRYCWYHRKSTNTT